MTQNSTHRTLNIIVDYDDVRDAKFILNNLSTVVLNKVDYESKHLSATVRLQNERHLPFQEPRFEVINGMNCMVFRSRM
jgi:hypothetical protein